MVGFDVVNYYLKHKVHSQEDPLSHDSVASETVTLAGQLMHIEC